MAALRRESLGRADGRHSAAERASDKIDREEAIFVGISAFDVRSQRSPRAQTLRKSMDNRLCHHSNTNSSMNYKAVHGQYCVLDEWRSVAQPLIGLVASLTSESS